MQPYYDKNWIYYVGVVKTEYNVITAIDQNIENVLDHTYCFPKSDNDTEDVNEEEFERILNGG